MPVGGCRSHHDRARRRVLSIARAGETPKFAALSPMMGVYPSVDERVLAELAVLTAEPNGDTMVLVTDKLGRYSMFDTERLSKSLG